MPLHPKALYNLLRLNHAQNKATPCEPWQIEDLRAVPLDELFKRLNAKEIFLDKTSFSKYAEECTSPEDLAELVFSEHEDPKQHDPVYLILFELWRRLLPERQSLSLFCDELDHRISLYDSLKLENDELIQDSLANLIEICEENTDAGAEAEEVWELMSDHTAHDIALFLIDYISSLLDAKNQLYATELLESFSPYIPDPLWFDVLRAHLTALSDPIEANRQISAILNEEEGLSVDLLLEMLRLQISYGELPIFIGIAKKILPRLQEEGEFRDLIELSADYFRRRDREDLEQAVTNLLKGRNPDHKFDLRDSAVKEYKAILQTSSHKNV